MSEHTATTEELLADLDELAANPLTYGQETHGELHEDAAKLIRSLAAAVARAEQERNRAMDAAERAIELLQTAVVGWQTAASSTEQERDEWRDREAKRKLDFLAARERAEQFEARLAQAHEALGEAPREWLDDADLFARYTAWLRDVAALAGEGDTPA